MGATTIWERWDSLRPDGSVNPGAMTSFNHYALGSVADWLYRTVGGLAPGRAGLPSARPSSRRPAGNLTHAAVRHRTPYGMAGCKWRIEGECIDVDVVVPANTTATVSLPGRELDPMEVGSGVHHWRYPYARPEETPRALTRQHARRPLRRPAVLERGAVLLASATLPDLMGQVVTTQRANGGVSLRQIVSSAPRSDRNRRGASPANSKASGSSMNSEQFRDPGQEYREIPFWSWNDLLDAGELRRQVRLIKEGGWGGFFMHSRAGLRTPYMGPDWLACVRLAVEEARSCGLQAWLYDEDKWPSGYAGGASVASNPEHRAKHLVCKVDARPNLLAERIADLSRPRSRRNPGGYLPRPCTAAHPIQMTGSSSSIPLSWRWATRSSMTTPTSTC